ncbi:MAG TPA: HAD-IA family hydrolase [Candidatus Limnocylindrales bacterium]|nr:HAD-IA family hydrolase [Candidatus Limnocylindrales bacterium]
MAAVIFDFDGTIGDSFGLIVDIFHNITKREERLTDQEMAELRGFPLAVVAHRLKVPAWRIPYLLIRGRYLMGKRMREVTLFEGMGKVIEELHAEGHELFIVSSNSGRNVKKFLKQHHLYKYFVEVRGNAGLLGKSRAISKLLKSNSLRTKESIYVGDETRDIVATKAINLRCIAVSWGFAETAFLESLQPAAVAYKPQDIVTILEEL